MKKLFTVAILLLVVTSLFSQKRFRPWQDKFYIKGGYNIPLGEFKSALDTALPGNGGIYGFQAEAGGLFIIRNFELSYHMRFGLDINASYQRNWKTGTYPVDYKEYEVSIPGTGRKELVTGPVEVRANNHLTMFGVKFGPTVTFLPAKWMYIDFYAKAYVAAAYWGSFAEYTADNINEWRDYDEAIQEDLSTPTIKPCFGINYRLYQLLIGAEFTTKSLTFQESVNSNKIIIPTSALFFNIGVNL